MYGLGGLVCYCVDWVAWSSSFFKCLSNYQSPKRKTNGCIVGRIKRTDGIDVSVELQYLLLSVKHRELHVNSTI